MKKKVTKKTDKILLICKCGKWKIVAKEDYEPKEAIYTYQRCPDCVGCGRDVNDGYFGDKGEIDMFKHFYNQTNSTMLNKEQEDKRSVATKMPIEQNPDPQNAQKEPVIDNLRDKFFKECTYEKQNDYFGTTRFLTVMSPEQLFDFFKPYLKSNSEPVIDWEGIEDGLYHLNIAEAWGPTDVVINWLKSNLSNYIK